MRCSLPVKSLKKSLFIVALLLFMQIALPPAGSAQPPDVNSPLDKRLYQGSITEIKTFIEKRRVKIDEIIAIIDKISQTENLPVNVNTPPNSQQELHKFTQSSATAVKDLFRGLSLQYKSLLAELSRTAPAAAGKPAVKGPPYSIESFDKITAFQTRINSQLTSINKRYTLLKNRLENLKESATAQLSNYARLRQTNANDHLLLYDKYGKLLNLQCEYALNKIKQPKLDAQIRRLNQLQKNVKNLVNESFSELEITPADIDKAQRQSDKKLQTFKETTNSTSAEYQDLNRRILIYEARLDKILEQIKNDREKSRTVENLQIEKERIELIIDALKLRIHIINQKRLNCKTRLLRTQFRLQWLNNHANRKKQKLLAGFIKEWTQEASKLSQKLEETATSISDVTLARSNLTQHLVNIKNRVKTDQPEALRLARAALSRQALKVNDNLDKLILALSDNSQEIRNTEREIEQILDLTRFMISRKARIRTWSELHLEDLKRQSLQALYFPLFAVGTSTVTLMIIIKIIFLFFLGIASLRLLRRKIAHLLEKKANMSIGAINSITTLVYYACILIGTMIILTTAGLDLSQLGIILGALGVGIGFGLQSIANNFISGIILLGEQTIKVGDYVHLVDGVVGEVRKMSLRTTVVRTVEGEDIIVPNSDFISNRVNTWTYGDDWRRLNIPFGVAYDSDPGEVVKLAEAAAREVSITREDFIHPLHIFFEGFGDNSLDFSIRAWCRMTNLKAPSGLKSDYYFALHRKLKEAGITIPFPQHDLHLQSINPKLREELKSLMDPDAQP